MEISPLLVLLVVWWLFGVLTSGKRGRQRREQQRQMPRPPAPVARPTSPGGDPTQREGGRLERIMREFERALEEASQTRQPKPEPEPSWDAQEDWEERDEEEVAAGARPRAPERPEPLVRSLEEDFHRPEREIVILGGDQDELQRRRVAWAEERNRALTAADHRRFDARIRAPHQDEPEAALVSPAPAGPMQRLRQAVVWRELLGPPVGLREPDHR